MSALGPNFSIIFVGFNVVQLSVQVARFKSFDDRNCCRNCCIYVLTSFVFVLKVEGLDEVNEDGHTNALYLFYLISYVVIVNWILLQVAAGLKSFLTNQRRGVMTWRQSFCSKLLLLLKLKVECD